MHPKGWCFPFEGQLHARKHSPTHGYMLASVTLVVSLHGDNMMAIVASVRLVVS